MPLKSRWSCTIPSCSLPTYVFGSPDEPLPTTPLLFSAESPEILHLSLHTYRLLTKRIASGLISAGLLPGDRVLVYSRNNIYYPALFMGIIAAGGIFTGANPGFAIGELEYQLQDSGAKFCFVGEHEGGVDIAVEAARKVGQRGGDKVILFDDGLRIDSNGLKETWVKNGEELKTQWKGVKHWSEFLGSGDYEWVELKGEEVHKTVAINYSSGTTGIPKGVEISHRNYIANAIQNVSIRQLAKPIPNPIWIGVLPMYHAYGQTLYTTVSPVQRVPLYLLSSFNLSLFLSTISKYRITSVSVVPPIILALLKHPLAATADLSSVRSLVSGAAPLSAEVARAVERRVGGGIVLRQGWGLTEATCSVLGFHPDAKDTGASVGELMANCEGKVMDADTGTRELGIGEEGEMWIRAPNVTKGYWNRPDATKDTITPDGWLKTGDIGYYDEQGRWYIVDRKKELIKVKGNQVAPAELEGILLQHPGIVDAAVIGINYAEDERPRAYIVTRQSHLSPEEVTGWIEKRLVKHKWITGGVVFVDAIPRNPSGKILRKVLREQAKQEVSSGGDQTFRAKL